MQQSASDKPYPPTEAESPALQQASASMTRKIYLEPPWLIHAGQRQLVACPPSEYEFLVRETVQEQVFKAITNWDLLRLLLRNSDNLLPTGLVKSWLERRNEPPPGTALTYAVDHLVFRQEPWVLELELPFLLAGRDPKHLFRFKGVVERALGSPSCRRILCQSQASRRALLADLDPSGLEPKVDVVHYGTRPRFLTKRQTDKVRLFFLASDMLRPAQWSYEAFDYKGGADVLETFAQLRKHHDIELVVRARVPPDLRRRYSGIPGLRIIEDFIPSEELEWQYRTADIFLLPSITTIPATLLEAMSFELPVVTTDSWANAEYVAEGKTGFVVPRSRKRGPDWYRETAQPNFGSSEFYGATRTPDPEVVDALAHRVTILIEQPELRRRMGKAGRWEVEHGKFSLAQVNEQLRRIFDDAIAAGG